MKNALIYSVGNMVFLGFFNSKEIYSIKCFDTFRKAKNYAKKFNYQLFEKLPENIAAFDNCN